MRWQLEKNLLGKEVIEEMRENCAQTYDTYFRKYVPEVADVFIAGGYVRAEYLRASKFYPSRDVSSQYDDIDLFTSDKDLFFYIRRKVDSAGIDYDSFSFATCFGVIMTLRWQEGGQKLNLIYRTDCTELSTVLSTFDLPCAAIGYDPSTQDIHHERNFRFTSRRVHRVNIEQFDDNWLAKMLVRCMKYVSRGVHFDPGCLPEIDNPKMQRKLYKVLVSTLTGERKSEDGGSFDL